MPAPLTISQAADLVDLSIQKVFEKSSEPEAQYKNYFNFRKTDDYYEKDSSLSGLGEADFVDENSVIVSDIPVQGFDKTYTQNMVGIIVPFTFKMLIFGISCTVMCLYKLCKLRGHLYETIRSQARKGRFNDYNQSTPSWVMG